MEGTITNDIVHPAVVVVSSEAPVASAPPSSRIKDRLKHSRNETRRRARIRDQFERVRLAISCQKRDRYHILQAVIEDSVVRVPLSLAHSHWLHLFLTFFRFFFNFNSFNLCVFYFMLCNDV